MSIKSIIKKLFSRSDEDLALILPNAEKNHFLLKLNDLLVGTLECKDGHWYFSYSDAFKAQADNYKLIVGFPNIDEVYSRDNLWPFFKTRIPGLKQPVVKSIIEKENIDIKNENALLKRFGLKSLTNPYRLLPQ